HRSVTAAVIALPTIKEGVDVNSVAFANIESSFRRPSHDTGRIQSDYRRHRWQMMPVFSAHDGIHIGDNAAHLNLYEHVLRPRLGYVNLIDLEWLAEFM